MKTIRQNFSIKVGYRDKEIFHITARNFNQHQVHFGGDQERCLSTNDMRKLAEHLTKTANIIDADKDFAENV